jgi:hypothetical protein
VQLTTDKQREDARCFFLKRGFAATHEGMKRMLSPLASSCAAPAEKARIDLEDHIFSIARLALAQHSLFAGGSRESSRRAAPR